MTHRGTILWRCLINLAERYYPGAKYLGRPAKLATGSGTPEEVLAALPTAERSGASMLHLGCYARVGGSSASTRLDLAGQPLSVTRILRQAHNRAAEARAGSSSSPPAPAT